MKQKVFGRLRKISGHAGREVTRLALTLWYCALDKDTPTRLKLVIFGDLAYVLNPLDVIPDAIPIIGWTDDLAVMVATMGFLAMHIKPEHKAKAEDVVTRWFDQRV